MGYRKSRRIRRDPRFLIGAAVVAGIIAFSHDYSSPEPVPCHYEGASDEVICTSTGMLGIDVHRISPEFRQDMLNAGYKGIPGDSREAIYIPRSVAQKMCNTDTDCELAN